MIKNIKNIMLDSVNKKKKCQKINILHLINSLIIGGAEIVMLHYIKALGFDDYNHYVYSFGNDGPVRKKIEDLGLKVHFGPKRESIKNPYNFSLSMAAIIHDILSFIKAKRIQLIHSHLDEPNNLAVLLGKISRIPAFPTVHNTNYLLYKRNVLDPRVNLKKIINTITYKKADRVIAISPEVKQVIRHKYYLKESQVTVLKNGIVFKKTKPKTDLFQKEFTNSRKKFKIIAIGRLTYQKYFEILIKATAEVITKSQDIVVNIIGEGEDRIKLERLINELKVKKFVNLLGIRNDVMEIMNSSHIIVIPSRYEGLSISMIEAMACGLPVIASDAPGLSEYVKQGKNGFLFPVGDYKQMAEYILLLGSNKELIQTLSKGARNTFEKEFDINKNIKPLDKLFRQYAKI